MPRCSNGGLPSIADAQQQITQATVTLSEARTNAAAASFD